MIGWMSIFFIVLLAIIGYFLIRMKQQLKNTPGATQEMSNKELVKNWQAQKAADAQYHEELKAKAREEAKVEIERTLIDRYKQEAVQEAVTPKATQMAQKMNVMLGIDLSKAASKDNVAKMVGGRVEVGEGQVGSASNIFSQDRIDRMAGNGLNEKKLQSAAGSNINWDKGMHKALRNDHKMSGLDKALYRK